MPGVDSGGVQGLRGGGGAWQRIDGQVRAEKVLGEKTGVKILYFTQLLGIALGVSPRKLGVHENVSDGLAVLKERGIA